MADIRTEAYGAKPFATVPATDETMAQNETNLGYTSSGEAHRVPCETDYGRFARFGHVLDARGSVKYEEIGLYRNSG